MNKFTRKYLAAGLEGSFIHQKIIKAVIINVFSYLAIFALGYYTVAGIINEKGLVYVSVLGFMFVATIANAVYFNTKHNFQFSSNFMVLLMTLLTFALFTKIGTGVSGLFWFYVHAPFAIFILGRKTGTIYAASLFGIAVILLKIQPEFMTVYPQNIHSRFIFSYLIATSFPIIFEIVRRNTYLAFKAADQEKTEYLTQTLQQNEEIQAQKERIEEFAGELQKLSIAASKTDNSIMLFDTKGYVEWVNTGFTRLTGYTLQFYKEKYETLYDASSHPNFKKLLEHCITQKESVKYENQITKRNGEKVWVQTTITPIMDESGEVIRLISIDADINKIKEAEAEIILKNEEILAQKEELITQHAAISKINDELVEQRDKIQRQNEQIHSSLSYAKTIQTAMLPLAENIRKNYDFFVYYKAKDIVSGDFYWYSEIIKEHETFRFFAVVDCTGHGVPGAFMSMIVARLLNEIVNERGTHDTAMILEETDIAVKKALRQEKTENRDGFDICLIKHKVSDSLPVQIEFCGGKRPLYICRNNGSEMETVKGTRRSIGGFASRNKQAFESKIINCQKNDILYLTSDGYADQNNAERQKIGSVKLKELLCKYARLPMDKQKEKLANFIEDYQKGTVQRDDITLMGLKL